MKKYIILLVLVLSAILIKDALAQSYTPFDYSFPYRITGIDKNAFASPLEFVSMASNGYGHWGVTREGKWFLMSNDYPIGWDDDHEAEPKGPVQGGFFLNDFYWDGGFKVAANLRGSVRFVVPSPSYQSFLIYGFDDEHLRTIPDTPDIDIRFEGIPKKYNSRVPVKRAPRVWTVFTTGSSIVDGTIEPDWRDWFDIACDGSYLYITWCEYTNFNFEIWVTVVSLSTGLVETGFPKLVTQDPTPPNINTALFGRRPTISCDVRHNSNPATATPRFDIAYIGKTGAAAPGRVFHYYYDNGNFNRLALNNRVKYNATAAVTTYNSPSHCRILTSSTKDSTSKVKVVYATIDPDQQTNGAFGLIMYTIHNQVVPQPQIPTGHYATYVDGSHASYFSRPDPCPDGYWEIVDEHLIGFTNPYDGQKSENFREFHCLYQIQADSLNADSTFSYLTSPLFIVRSDHNGIWGTDTRTLLTRHSTDTGQTWLKTIESAGVGGANQQGIFVTWYGDDGAGDYIVCGKRNIRHLDEPIEENTLLTHANIVGDGLSHGGTIGAELLPGLKLTLWTDLRSDIEYDSVTIDTAYFYAPRIGYEAEYLNGRIKFLNGDTTEVKLTIGKSSGDDSTKCILTCLPNHLIKFEDQEEDLGQKILINPYSEMHYYGVQPLSTHLAHQYKSLITGAGEIVLKPHSLLNIHGGAELRLADFTKLIADTALIYFSYEQNVYPPYSNSSVEDSAGLNLPKNGKLTIHGSGTFTACEFEAPMPWFTTIGLISVEPTIFSVSSPLMDQFNATGCDFTAIQLTNPGVDYGSFSGLVNFEYKDGKNFRIVDIDNCGFYGITLNAYRVYNNFSVSNSGFQRFCNKAAINLTNPTGITQYGGITISDNEVLMDGDHGIEENALAASGIVIDNYSVIRDATHNNISITGNVITTSSESGQTAHAIDLNNTSALISENTITNPLGIGIKNVADLEGATPVTNSFLCSNIISQCKEAGIKTQKWRGHGRMNRVSESDVGHVSGTSDNAGITYSRYFDNVESGLYLTNSTTRLNLKGRTVGSNFEAAYDTIDHNNDAHSSTEGEIRINGSELVLGYPDSLYSHEDTIWAFNSIISDQTGQKFIYNEGDSVVIPITANYWGTGTNWSSLTAVTTPATLRPLLVKVGFEPNFPVMGLSPYARPGVPVCGTSYTWGTRPNDQQPSVMNEASCSYLKDRGESNFDSEKYKFANDTLRLYIENCATDNSSWRAFLSITPSVFFMNTLRERWVEYREWLKKVLYYNTSDSNYYCSDVSALLETFKYFEGRGEPDRLGSLAVVKYIEESGKCSKWYFIEQYDSLVAQTLRNMYSQWRDTTKDTVNSKPDSTLPTIDELGLGILRGPSNVVGTKYPVKNEILSFNAERNPFEDQLNLSFELAHGAVLRIEIFDALGRSMYSDGLSWRVTGVNSIQIDGTSWAEGTYYARLSTLRGEVRTVKLIK